VLLEKETLNADEVEEILGARPFKNNSREYVELMKDHKDKDHTV
jgi:hypothetical protein